MVWQGRRGDPSPYADCRRFSLQGGKSRVITAGAFSLCRGVCNVSHIVHLSANCSGPGRIELASMEGKVGIPELILILGIALLVFGPSKLGALELLTKPPISRKPR